MGLRKQSLLWKLLHLSSLKISNKYHLKLQFNQFNLHGKILSPLPISQFKFNFKNQVTFFDGIFFFKSLYHIFLKTTNFGFDSPYRARLRYFYNISSTINFKSFSLSNSNIFKKEKLKFALILIIKKIGKNFTQLF